MNSITKEELASYRQKYESSSAARAASAALAKTEIKDVVYVPMSAARLHGDFSIEIPTMHITAQQKSGRCWLFAAMNIMREKAAEKLGLEQFELSGNYLAFYDKLEKANNALELAIQYADRPLSDHWMEYILQGFHDGGYWDMAVDLVKKYGVVPKSAMPETYQSTHTEKFMTILNSLIKKDIAELRKMISEGEDPAERKEEMLGEVYELECMAFGEPPVSFHFEYRDKEGNYHSDRDITPHEFYNKYIGIDLDEYVTVTCEPTHLKPMNFYYSFHYIGSMAESSVRCLNLTIDELEDLCINQLEDDSPVWFGCDAGAFGDREKGVWDPDSFAYKELFDGIDFAIQSKTDRLEYRDSYSSHAMILTGVNLDENGQPDRWKIENSWGEEVGRKGYFVCSEKYFRNYVYEAIIRKQYLSDAQKKLLEAKPTEIKPWEI